MKKHKIYIFLFYFLSIQLYAEITKYIPIRETGFIPNYDSFMNNFSSNSIIYEAIEDIPILNDYGRFVFDKQTVKAHSVLTNQKIIQAANGIIVIGNMLFIKHRYSSMLYLLAHLKKVHDGTGMGDYMIVQDAYDKNKYYLLLHLAYESWKKYNISIGTKVYPGMKVAGVGKQDYSETAYHLHISVAVLLPSEKAIPEDDKKGPVIIRDSNYLFPIWGYNAKMRDPFNHKITWKGRS